MFSISAAVGMTTPMPLDIEKMNEHNLYKDRIRTWELQARKKMR